MAATAGSWPIVSLSLPGDLCCSFSSERRGCGSGAGAVSSGGRLLIRRGATSFLRVAGLLGVRPKCRLLPRCTYEETPGIV